MHLMPLSAMCSLSKCFVQIQIGAIVTWCMCYDADTEYAGICPHQPQIW
mgnify:CR=1 FL=1